MHEIQPDTLIPIEPSFMSDKEFVRAVQYQLDQSRLLPLAWQRDMLRRLENLIK